MKPPPRKRTKRDANFKTEQNGYKRVSTWKGEEQRNLLKGLKALFKTNGSQSDLDYAALKEYVPTRSTTEIEYVVDAFKDKIISSMCTKIETMRRDYNNALKPIEQWTHMASVVAGPVEEPITSAFSQMLIVSSTEPCTLKNCDPPLMDKLLQTSPHSRVIPFRPIRNIPVQGKPLGINAAGPLPIPKPPASTESPAKRLVAPSQMATTPAPPPQQQSSKAAGTPPLASVTSCQTSKSVSPSTHVHAQTTPQHQTPTVCSAAAATPVPSTSDISPSLPSAASSSVPSDKTPTIGPTGKKTTTYHPRPMGVNSIVSFEKIYLYLGAITQPGKGCKLTPMESAIVLDLLMSLPEELPLLDCKSLKKHLIQVYHALSLPADPKMIEKLFKDLSGAGETERHTAGSEDGADAQSTSAPEADPQQDHPSRDAEDTGPKARQPQETDVQSPGTTNTHRLSEDNKDRAGLCPPLNPFMVPLELLRKKSSAK